MSKKTKNATPKNIEEEPKIETKEEEKPIVLPEQPQLFVGKQITNPRKLAKCKLQK